MHSTGAENQWWNKSLTLFGYIFKLCQFAGNISDDPPSPIRNNTPSLTKDLLMLLSVPEAPWWSQQGGRAVYRQRQPPLWKEPPKTRSLLLGLLAAAGEASPALLAFPMRSPSLQLVQLSLILPALLQETPHLKFFLHTLRATQNCRSSLQYTKAMLSTPIVIFWKDFNFCVV